MDMYVVAKQVGRPAGRAADPLRSDPCEVANSIAVFRELSWLTRRMAKVKLDRKAAGLRLAHLPHSHRLGLAYFLDITWNVRVRFALAGISNRFN